MQKAIDAMKKEFASIRSGRATPGLVDNIKVDAYGNPTPLNQLANISAPEPNLLIIQPWDKNVINDIQKAIQKSDLGINPANDGNIIRLVVPAPTEERRKDMVRLIKKRVEDAKIQIRNIRRDSMEEFKKLEKDKEISQDDGKRAADKLQKITDNFIKESDQVGKEKETEILEI